ncbi:MAG: hypothetical protein V3U09_01390 [Thermoplasmata archaeon]
MARTIEDYGNPIVATSHSAMLELAVTLAAYRDALVLIGGWVPYLLLQRYQQPENPYRHIGSIDIDWVVDSDRIDEQAYDTIVKRIKERGYVPSETSLFSFQKKVKSQIDGKPYTIETDFLTSAPARGEGRMHRHRSIQNDLTARTLEGASVVLENCCEISISGVLPNGAKHETSILVADVLGFLTTKGLALGDRYKEKDAYDIYSVLANYKGGPLTVAQEVRGHLGNQHTERAVQRIQEWFGERAALGPAAVADFFRDERGEARKRRITDAHQVALRFLEELGMA